MAPPCGGRSFVWAAISIAIAATQLLLTLIVTTVQAQGTGFLSIDCGPSNLQNYTDESTKIQWAPDIAIWPDIGNWSAVSSVIRLPVDMPDQVQYSTYRYFPSTTSYKALNQSKFCYTLPAISDNYYLIRASFWYNPTVMSGTIRFHVIVDTYEGVEIVITLPQANPWFEEMYVRAQTGRSSISVCLAAASAGSSSYPPFINSLELRPLQSTMKSVEMIRNTNTAMRTVLRVDLGAASTLPQFLRYPEDTLDRFWWRSLLLAPDNVQVSSQPVVVDAFISPDLPPPAVMQTNFLSFPGGYKFNISTERVLSTSTVQGQHLYYMVLWFAELDPLVNASGQRAFNVSIDDGQIDHQVLFFSVVDVYAEVGRYKAYEIFTLTDKPLGPFANNFLIRSSQAATSLYPPTLAAAEVLQLFDIPMNATTPTSPSDVLAIEGLVTSTMPTLRSFVGDPCLPLAYKYPWIGCDSTNPRLPARITSILLSSYGLVGNIPSSISTLDELTTLDLSNNHLSGTIPDSLANLPKLTYLNLANNRLTGNIPAALLQKPGLVFRYEGNQFTTGNNNMGLIIGATVGAVVLLSIAIVVVTLLCICRRNSQTKESVAATQLVQAAVNTNPQLITEPIPLDPTAKVHVKKEELMKATNVAREFSFQEIQIATNNLSQLLGQGGFGPVYKGTLSTGFDVAIKILANASQQGAQEFLNEVTLLSRVHHKNLVGFVGYSIERSLILVYEFMSNGSLHDALSGKHMPRNLTWRERLRILSDAAQGLSYLHHGCNIIHRDVKSSNILLSENLEGKMSDFGISRLTPYGTDNAATTRVVGTPGYLDPAYAYSLQLTEKADIYSFGVVLLEAICGQPPILMDANKRREIHITEWVRSSYESGMIERIVDERFEGKYNVSSIWKVAEIAVECVKFEAVNRPTMIRICTELNEAIRIEENYESSPMTTGEYLGYSSVQAR